MTILLTANCNYDARTTTLEVPLNSVLRRAKARWNLSLICRSQCLWLCHALFFHLTLELTKTSLKFLFTIHYILPTTHSAKSLRGLDVTSKCSQHVVDCDAACCRCGDQLLPVNWIVGAAHIKLHQFNLGEAHGANAESFDRSLLNITCRIIPRLELSLEKKNVFIPAW